SRAIAFSTGGTSGLSFSVPAAPVAAAYCMHGAGHSFAACVPGTAIARTAKIAGRLHSIGYDPCGGGSRLGIHCTLGASGGFARPCLLTSTIRSSSYKDLQTG